MKTVVQEQKQNHHHTSSATNVTTSITNVLQEKPGSAMVIVNSIGANSTSTSSTTSTHPDEENLAMPISWNENESPLPLIRRAGDRNNTSPVHWSVVSALVDLSQSATPQPLNLSTSGNRRT